MKSHDLKNGVSRKRRAGVTAARAKGDRLGRRTSFESRPEKSRSLALGQSSQRWLWGGRVAAVRSPGYSLRLVRPVRCISLTAYAVRPWGVAPNPTSLLKQAGPKTFTFAHHTITERRQPHA